MKISQLIRALGGPVKVAGDLGKITPQAISKWITTEKVPAGRRAKLRGLAAENNLPIPDGLR